MNAGSRRDTLLAAVLGLVVGMAVVAPWVRDGYLLLLDWVSGPSQTLTPGVYGLSGSALDAMPFRIVTQVSRALVGSAATAWLIILAYFPLAAAGAAVVAGGSAWRRFAAALFMVCNPVVVDRIRVGHVAFLLGIAMLPWLFSALLEARRRNKWFAVRPALWYALAISVSPHAAWLGVVLIAAVALLPRTSVRDLVRSAQVVLAAGLVYGYALVLWLTNTPALNVTDADLQAYATRSGPGGALATVATLHGFWRTAPEDTVREWLGPVLGVVVLLLLAASVILGFGRLLQVEVDRAAPLLAVTVVGLLFAAGVDGPVGVVYRAAFDRLPLFEAMREQQKWIGLALLGYAVAFAVAAEWVALRVRRRSWLFAVPVVCVPLLIAPTLVWGLGGTVRTSQYPLGWYAANLAMGRGTGQALFLPWHAYQPFGFSGDRTIATPANAFFHRTVITSDAVELPGLRSDSTSLRTAYVDRLVADAGAGAFGRLVAPLGVEYIVLAKTSELADYVWIDDQPDLRKVLDTSAMSVYQVVPRGTGRVVDAWATTYEQLVASAAAGGVGSEAVLNGTGSDAPPVSDLSGGLTRLSPTRWRVEAGPAGWVVLPEEYSDGWQVGGRSGVPTLAGTIALEAGAESFDIDYAPWRYLMPATLMSMGVLVVLVAGGLVEHRQALTARLRPARTPGQEAGS